MVANLSRKIIVLRNVSMNDAGRNRSGKSGVQIGATRNPWKNKFPTFPSIRILFSFPSLSHALSRVRLLKRPGAITFKNSESVEESLLRTIASDTASAKTTKTTTKSGKMSCRFSYRRFGIVSLKLITCAYNESSRLRADQRLVFLNRSMRNTLFFSFLFFFI